MSGNQANKELKVIGVGLARTGTLSLKYALETLLGGKCHHMLEMRGSGRTNFKLWHKAIEHGDLCKEEWDEVYQDYIAAVDNPTVVFYQNLIKHYPEAKVILTIRDPDAWYKSFNFLVTSFQALPTLIKLYWWIKFGNDFKNFMMKLRAKLFLGGPAMPEDKEFSIQGYYKHIEDVKSSVEPERLLVFDVREGWEPLCKFLDKPIPEIPFPRANDTATIAKMFRVHRIISYTGQTILLAAIVAGAAYIWKKH